MQAKYTQKPMEFIKLSPRIFGKFGIRVFGKRRGGKDESFSNQLNEDDWTWG